MKRYLLDTNIISDAVKNPQGNVARHMGILAKHDLVTSIIVSAELHYGIAKKGSSMLTERVETLLSCLTILPLDLNAAYHYGEIRLKLEQSGRVIGGNDLLIAAHALAIDAILVTDNVKEFARIPNLFLENWLHSP